MILSACMLCLFWDISRIGPISWQEYQFWYFTRLRVYLRSVSIHVSYQLWYFVMCFWSSIDLELDCCTARFYQFPFVSSHFVRNKCISRMSAFVDSTKNNLMPWNGLLLSRTCIRKRIEDMKRCSRILWFGNLVMWQLRQFAVDPWFMYTVTLHCKHTSGV